MKTKICTTQQGFTLIELLMIMGIMAILLGIVTINLSKVQRNTNLATAIETMEADMKNQQLKAINGASSTGTHGDSYGIYFDSSQNNRYMLFQGTSHSGDCSSNLCVSVDSSITLTPSTATREIVFSQQSGEISSSATVTISNTLGESKQVTINKYGVVTQVN